MDTKTKIELATVRGSHGTLDINYHTGMVIEYHPANTEPEPDPDGYQDIFLFNLPEYCAYWKEPLQDSYDILDLGYWYRDTKTSELKYEPPADDWRKDYAREDRRFLRPKREALAEHFGLRLYEVVHDNTEYPDKFTIMGKPIEVVSPQEALANELDNLNGNAHRLHDYISDTRIGIYTYLHGGKYLFRWL